MQIVRFRAAGKTRHGVVEGAVVVEYAGTPWSPFRRGRVRYPLRQVVLLAPALPSKIVAVGGAPVERPDEPRLFLKPASALAGPDDPIVVPAAAGGLTCGAALAAVIRRPCRNVPPARAREYVLGYTALNDVTAPAVAARDGDCTRAKAYDTFCPLGPGIATDLDPHAATVETWVNGVLRASASTKDLGLALEGVVAHVSAVMTLLPGDVVAPVVPGLPVAVAPGDRVEIRVEGVGGLKNTVVRP
jgi:2-keto-4-pentenoate hydratase/2-oxohepta-3-ene-1,7-dioic acid hydratase in catechol pathway